MDSTIYTGEFGLNGLPVAMIQSMVSYYEEYSYVNVMGNADYSTLIRHLIEKEIDFVNKIFGENYKVYLGGSSIFGAQLASDYDILVIGKSNREDFLKEFTRIFQTCGYFINARCITNDYTEYIKLENNDTHFDIHYCYTKKNISCKEVQLRNQ